MIAMTKDEALKMAIEALKTAEIQSEYDGLSNLIFKAIQACKDALETPECNTHPDAPHGFCRDASHSADRYVCECEFWELEWQALSDDEIEEIMFGKNGTYFNFARAIEQASKEKNS